MEEVTLKVTIVSEVKKLIEFTFRSNTFRIKLSSDYTQFYSWRHIDHEKSMNLDIGGISEVSGNRSIRLAVDDMDLILSIRKSYHDEGKSLFMIIVLDVYGANSGNRRNGTAIYRTGDKFFSEEYIIKQ